jgi:acyl-CoA synthetase (AMP-forming)/AMP-acid ligase II
VSVRAAEHRRVSYNLAELFERVADVVPEREAVVTPDVRRTYAQLDARASKLAHALAARGVGRGDHVGLQLHNGAEYLEAMLAAYKLSAVPVNVNYRYVESELAHLYDDADLIALVYHRTYAPNVGAAIALSPVGGPLLIVDDESGHDAVDGSLGYEDVLVGASAARDFTGRSSDDLYIAYTGGTTGMPKGVLWRHEDIFFAAMGGGDPTTALGPISQPSEIVDRVLPVGAVMLLLPPLMHVSAQWGAFSILYGGGTVVLTGPGSLDARKVWSLVGAEHANVLTVVGDAMARPLLDALAADPAGYDVTSLFVFASGGAALSGSTKAQIASLLPNVITVDGYGSTETGVSGSRVRMPGGEVEEAARFTLDRHTSVLDDHLGPVAPGSGVIGRLARRGHLPIGYYNDPDTSATTFVQVDGVRWALTGDAATVDRDGTIVLLGRGSMSINTGGEKVYPEEVEAVLKDLPSVYDAVVVGAPHERWGEQVVAVVAPRAGATVTLDEIREHGRHFLAGYKLPRALCIVDVVVRGPNGKADYQWARAHATASGG